jgi:hypothetical protein
MLAKSTNGNRLIGKIGVHKDFANKAVWNDDGTPKAPVVKTSKAKAGTTISDLSDSDLALIIKSIRSKG